METKEADKLVSIAKQFLLPFGADASFFGPPGSIIESAKGRHFVDIFGNRFLDTTSCAGACSLGFNVPEIMEAVLDQMNKIINTTPARFAPTRAAVLLAEKIASISPGSLKYTLYGCNGGDANEAAVKIARHYWKVMGKGSKYKVISRFPRGYHGMSLSMCSASGHKWRRVPYEPLASGFVHFHAPNCYRCPFSLTYPACGLMCAREFRQIVEFEDPSTVACYIGEQTIGGGGVLPPPPGYMKMIREICDEYDILLIADEVVTGFGKTGFWFECEKYGIVPDFIAMGKSMSAGCGPISGTHIKAEIAEVFTGENALQQGYTFAGIGYLAAAALATVNYIESHKLLARATEIGARLSRELGAIQDRSAVVGDVRVNGVMMAVELVKHKATKEEFPDRHAVADVVTKVGIDNGVMLNCNYAYEVNIQAYVPLTITDDELGLFLDTIDKAVVEVEKRFLCEW